MENNWDEFLFSLLPVHEEFPDIDSYYMSDAKYAEVLQFQDVITSSITTNSVNDSISSSKYNSIEVGESSGYLCEICTDKKDINQMFSVHNCMHSYCTECITKYVEIKLESRAAESQENARFIACPGLDCTGLLRLDSCRRFMPSYVVSMWEDALCESSIVSSQRFYCPFKDCSAMIVNDSGEVIRASECPFCRRLFCAQCKVPWHSGVDCDGFSSNNRGRDDLMMYELAKKKKWQRCPRCKFFVEKSQGCLHMICRCKHEFCYSCGATWSSTHGGYCQPRAPRLSYEFRS